MTEKRSARRRAAASPKPDTAKKKPAAVRAKMPSITQETRALATLTRRKRRLDAQLAYVKSKIAEIEEPLSERWAENGLTKMTIRGATAYVQPDRWPKLVLPDDATDKQKEEVKAKLVATLKKMGHDGLITVNWQSLRGLIKDWTIEDDDGVEEIVIPPALAKLVRVDEKPRIRFRFS